MGGNITSYASIDPRLKAVIPMVGGSGFITSDFPGVPDSGRARGYHDHADLFAKTMESQSYYPHTKCPVMFLSATDDFHSAFDHIYAAMDALPHDNWRVSQNLNFNHNLGPEQWILINRWFDQYLTGKEITHPKTPASTFTVEADKHTARYSVIPDQHNLVGVEFYYSHDPNPRSRFWIQAEANVEGKDGTRSVELPVRDKLPLFAFANCTYKLDSPVESLQGTASTFAITSKAAAYYPEELDATLLNSDAKPQPVFSDIENDGFRDWGFNPRGGLLTYKFRDPRATTPEQGASLKVTIIPHKKGLSYRFRIAKNRYIAGVKEPQIDYSTSREIPESGKQELIFTASNFKTRDKTEMTDWAAASATNPGTMSAADCSPVDASPLTWFARCEYPGWRRAAATAAAVKPSGPQTPAVRRIMCPSFAWTACHRQGVRPTSPDRQWIPHGLGDRVGGRRRGRRRRRGSRDLRQR